MNQDRHNANFSVYSNSFKSPFNLAILVEGMPGIKVEKKLNIFSKRLLYFLNTLYCEKNLLEDYTIIGWKEL